MPLSFKTVLGEQLLAFHKPTTPLQPIALYEDVMEPGLRAGMTASSSQQTSVIMAGSGYLCAAEAKNSCRPYSAQTVSLQPPEYPSPYITIFLHMQGWRCRAG